MNITSIKIQRTNISEKVKALVEVTAYGELAIHDIKVIAGTDKLFVAMPSRKEDGGRYLDIVHPISPEARKQIEDAVLSAYNEHIAKIAEKHLRDKK